jgi:hypothetical protein
VQERGEIMVKKALFAFCYLLFITLVFSEDNNELVIYQPTSEMVNTYFGMYQYLNDWENNPSKIDTDTFTNLYQNYVGEPVKFFL